MISFLLSIRQPFRVFFVFLYVGCIMALSLLPPQDFPRLPMIPHIDKLVHFSMYFIFSVLSCWALKTESNYFRLLFIVFATGSWGIFMEYIQLVMRIGRTFSWFDVLFNCIGVLFGILFYVIAIQFSNHRQTAA